MIENNLKSNDTFLFKNFKKVFQTLQPVVMNERSGATAEKPHDYRSAIKTDEILIKTFQIWYFR